MKRRCRWATGKLEMLYHDEEWGVPLHDDRKLFELLILEGAQAGLSWSTILSRREAYRTAFDRFDPQKVARYTEKKVEQLLANKGIIRNRLKIGSAIRNAQAFLAVQREHGSFDAYIWRFVDGNAVPDPRDEPPAETEASRAMSKDMRKHGFTFVGPTICYAFMQATGMVNDHARTCFRRRQIEQIQRSSRAR